MMPAKFDLISLVVRDMKTALDFYRALGWSIPAELDGEGHAEIALPNGLRFAWDTVEMIHSFDPHWVVPSDAHRMALAFLYDSASEVDSAYGRLVGLGYRGHTTPFDAFWGQRYAQIEDPDGHIIDLFAPLP